MVYGKSSYVTCDCTDTLFHFSHFVAEEGRDSPFLSTEHYCLLDYQARRLVGFEGVRLNPPFDLQIILYTPLNKSL